MLFIFLSLIHLAQADLFGFILETQQQRCLNDNLSKGTVIALQIIANSTEFEFKILQGQDKPQTIENYKNQILIRYTLTMWNDDQMLFCFYPYGSKNIKFDISYKKGVEVNDQRLIANREDLNQLEIEVNKLDDLLYQIQEKNKRKDEFVQEGIGQQITFFTLSFMGLFCVCTFFIVRSVKGTLKSKKII